MKDKYINSKVSIGFCGFYPYRPIIIGEITKEDFQKNPSLLSQDCQKFEYEGYSLRMARDSMILLRIDSIEKEIKDIDESWEGDLAMAKSYDGPWNQYLKHLNVLYFLLECVMHYPGKRNISLFDYSEIDRNDLRRITYDDKVLLHEIYLKSCLKTWQETKSISVELPKTDDADYKSLDTLLRHILRAARGYMTWMCDKLDMPDPEIEKTPEADLIGAKADEYVFHLLEKWRLPLSDITEDKFHTPTYTSRWGVDYCIDAMLEHAVMHPIRHEFQLKHLITNKINNSKNS